MLGLLRQNQFGMKKYNNKLILFFIVIMMPLTGAGIDIYTPSLPSMMDYFSVSQTLVQTSIGIYLIGYSIGQLILGTISDCFGRKYILLPSCLVYILVCLLSPLSPSIHVFLISRLMQGLAVAGPGIVAKALLSDCFTGHALKKASNYLTISWAAGPILAPVIGGYLQYYVGWEGNFYFLSAYGFMILISSLIFLPETKTNRVPFRFENIKSNYLAILRSRIFIGGFLLIALGYSFMTAFNVMGSFIIQTTLHFSPVQFGHLSLLLGASWFFGNLINRPFLNHFSNKQIIVKIVWAMLISAVILSLIMKALPFNIYTVMIPTCLFFSFGGLIMPNGVGITLSLFPNLGGTVNAIFAAFYIMGSSLTSFIASKLGTDSQMPLIYLYCIISFSCVVVYYLTIQKFNEGAMQN